MFNQESRKLNASRNAVSGIASQVVSLLTGFVFRTVFLKILSKEYLGLNGLFTEILTILSLVELGVGATILYRMYAPIAANDVDKVAALMGFYKKIYRLICLIVLVVGLAFLPLIKYFIKDPSEIPSDINIYVIYLLYLGQTLVSYLFVYRTSVFQADQNNYMISIMYILAAIVGLAAKLSVLLIFKDYTLTLVVSILASLSMNIIFSFLATKKYPEVFSKKIKLDKETVTLIKQDVYATMCHKVGGTVVTSTDSIILSAFIGVGVLGIYSNYTMLINAVYGLVAQLFGSFVSSIGSSKIKLDSESYYENYKRVIYANSFVTCFTCVGLFCLLNPFIDVWIGENMLMSMSTVSLLVGSYFLKTIRLINNSYTNATGLFRKDKIRPFIEAGLNLIISIVLVRVIGVNGIFVGTIVSNLCTVFWREPYLLYKYEFQKKVRNYFIMCALSLAFIVANCVGIYYLFSIMPNDIWWLILKFVIVLIVPNVLYIILTFRLKEFKFFVAYAKALVGKIIRKRKKDENTV